MPKSVAEVKAILRDEKIRFLRLVFSDIHGVIKNVEVPDSQFDKALAGEIMFDGSSIEGFVRIQESDMLLRPDLDSVRIYPAREEAGRVAMLICDVALPDGSPFPGDPRYQLKRAIEAVGARGFTPMMGPEAEFFLFQRNPDGTPTTLTHDTGAYFDLTPVDRGEDARREIVNVLEKMDFEVEAAHHEVAPGQHEVDFKYAHALQTADNLLIFRHVVRRVALRHNLHASFMPKPLYGVNGSGMHTHQSLFTSDGRNAFDDPSGEYGLSDTARHYIGGILRHAKAICAVTNPTVNSFKRLVPGYEAPTNIAWSEKNRSPLARVPARRGLGARVEVRMPDPSCNPYLAFAVMLAAGLHGIEDRIDPGPPVNKDIFNMSEREKRRLKIDSLPADLYQAVRALQKDKIVLDALGEHIAEHFISGKLQDWNEYISIVHPWEVDRYLSMY
ncbi:MAG: type I glutamate--ammonia ligase [Acidobacteria bacterium]|nr:MAG: type I glutamate--ammonia ligase [Acidobacteriota bacterium]